MKDTPLLKIRLTDTNGIRLSRFPPSEISTKRYGAFGFGLIISNSAFKGISIVIGF